MSKRDTTLTHERLKQLLHYEPLTGIFTRLTRSAQCNKVGDIAGGIEKHATKRYNRLNISIENVRHRAHRLAWFYVHGVWPRQEIDHIDGNPLNNAISNLRNVSRIVNCENQRRPQKHNTTGFLGIFYEKRQRKFIAKINSNGKQIHLGTFATPEEAHAAYLSAKRRLHEGCTI